jgi:hypothetical protein
MRISHLPDASLLGAPWRKSSYSNEEGGVCVEVADCLPDVVPWRKSSYSNEEGGECVEVADGHPGVVPVRDSKNPTGPALLVNAGAWQAFTAQFSR